MDFKSRSNKYRKKQSADTQRELGVIQIDESMMNIFCSYAISENMTIHKYGLSSLYSLLTFIDESYFDKNIKLTMKYNFAKKAVEIRLSGIHDRQLILSDINRFIDVTPILADPQSSRELSNDEVKYVESIVGDFLNNVYINKHIGQWINLVEEYKSANYRDRNQFLPQIRKAATDLLYQFRKNDTDKDTADTLFRLTDMEANVVDIHREITKPSFKLVTGMQGMNAMLGGGLEPGCVYSFFGLPGEGKTVTLENLFYQVWKHNRGYECKDKTKRPCIVFLTMENYVRQTVAALYHIITQGKNLRDCETAQEAIDEFKSHAFEFDQDNPNSIEMVIKFKPVHSVTTNYMYELVENLSDEGYEVICFFQDYVKRILPIMNTGDPYQDLGNIINDFRTFAILNKIPVVTASQLNRDAAKLIDEGRNMNKLDLVKKLGRANIGESSRMNENLDGTFIIAPEFDSDGNRYMGIKLAKKRYEIAPTAPMAIYQPFYPGAPIAMVEDVYESMPVYRESLMRDAEEIRKSFGNVERVSINKTVKALEGLTNIMANKYTIPGSVILPPKVEDKKADNTEPKYGMKYERKPLEVVSFQDESKNKWMA